MLLSNPFHMLWTKTTLLCAAVPCCRAVQNCNNPEMPRSAPCTLFPLPFSLNVLSRKSEHQKRNTSSVCINKLLNVKTISCQNLLCPNPVTRKCFYTLMTGRFLTLTSADSYTFLSGQLHFSLLRWWSQQQHKANSAGTTPSFELSFITIPGQPYTFSYAQQCQHWPEVFDRQLLVLIAGCFSEQ